MRAVDPRLLQHAKAARSHLIVTVLLGLATTGLIMAQAALLAHALAAAALGTGAKALAGTLVMLLVVVVARGAAAYGAEAAALRAAARVKSQLRRKLIRHCLRLGPAWLGGQQPGQVAVQATRGLDGLDPYFARYLPQLVLSAAVPLAVVVTVTAADWISGVVIAVTLPLIPLFAALVGLHTRAQTRRQWALLAQLGGHFLDVVQGLPTLKAFGRAKFQEQVIAKVTDEHRSAAMATLRVAFLSALVLELSAALATAVVAVETGLRLLYGHLPYQTALLVLLLTPEAYLPLRAVAAQYHASAEGTAAAESIFTILETRDVTKYPLCRDMRVSADGPRAAALQPTSKILDVYCRSGDTNGPRSFSAQARWAGRFMKYPKFRGAPAPEISAARYWPPRTAPAMPTGPARPGTPVPDTQPVVTVSDSEPVATFPDTGSAVTVPGTYPAVTVSDSEPVATFPDTRPAATLHDTHSAATPPDTRPDTTLHNTQPAATFPGTRPVTMLPDLRSATIRLTGVTVAYTGRDRPVLGPLSLVIRPGELIMVTGPSGAGKSTLLRLLLRFTEPASGTARVGEADLAAVPEDFWRSQISWVPQHPRLFDGSVADNIALGRSGAPQAAIEHAARLAGAAEFIEALPHGYDTPLGERAAWLSAGQRQQLALARAFLRDAPLLLLDEPTAHLAPAAAAAIDDVIRGPLAGRTIILATHRNPGTSGASQVIALDLGRLAGTASWLAAPPDMAAGR